MGLISVTDLDARQVEYVDVAQAQAAIDDASAVARACVEPTLDDVEAPNTPAAVVAIVVAGRPPRDTHPVSGTPPVQAQGPSRSDEALRELDLRFARGEVDEDGYRRTRDLLTHPPA